MSLERDFAAWIEHRDVGALTRVFDATAGRLLVLAMHLAGDGGAAEDLLQSTFVAAMVGAASWDRQRPVAPWLAGILQNEARMQWRGRRRRREVGAEHAADAPVPAPDPADQAAADDAFAAVLRTIDALPLAYRQALRLRLVHGLRPQEIARVLEVPVGTVRARLHRGLAQLRLALPAGVAGLAVVWLASGGSLLAQVRAQVLAKATATAGAASAVPLTLAAGWWSMHTKSVVFVVLGLAAVLAVALSLDLSATPGPAAPPGATPAVAAAALPAMSPTDPAPPAGPQREAVPAPTGPAWSLLVAAITAEDAPVPGARVRVWIAANGANEVDDGPPMRRLDLAAGTTDAAGHFCCDLDGLHARSALFRATNLVFVEASGRGATRVESMNLPDSTAPRQLVVECRLEPQHQVVGRVVDGRGTGVAGARLVWRHGANGRRESLTERSAEDGSFRIAWRRDEGETGEATLIASSARHGIGTGLVPAVEDGAASPTDDPVDLGTIVLAAGATVRGRVELGDGAGLGGFPVDVLAIDETTAADPAALRAHCRGGANGTLAPRGGALRHVALRTATDSDGGFVAAGLDPDVPYAVFVRDLLLRPICCAARPGGPDVRLVVAGHQLLSLDVHDEVGESLPGAGVTAECFDPAGAAHALPHFDRPGFPAEHYCGTARILPLDGRGRRLLLSPFGIVLRIGCSAVLAEGDCLRHEAFPGLFRAERSLALRPAAHFGTLRLTVVDERGEPYGEYGLVLTHRERDLQIRRQQWTSAADADHEQLPIGRWHLAVQLGPGLPYAPLFPTVRGTEERDVVIEADRATAVRVVAAPLGRAVIRLHSAAPFAGRVPLRVTEAASGAPVAFDPLVPEENWPSFDPWAGTTVLLMLRPLAPGHHEFVVTPATGEPVRCAADVVADRATKVSAELAPQ